MQVFIIGITGTIGTALAEHHHKLRDRVIGCARNESKIVEWIRERQWAKVYSTCATQLTRKECTASEDFYKSDKVYLLSALKHVDICERQPHEAIYQNVTIPSIISDICKTHDIPLVFSSTDKAYQPSGVYGATKLIAENLVIQNRGTVVRLANVIGSSGSVFETWKYRIEKRLPIQLTHPDMTRFFITKEQAAELLAGNYLSNCLIPRQLKSARIGDLADHIALRYDLKLEITGLRAGESLHQTMGMYTESSEHATRWDDKELLTLGGFIYDGSH